MMALVNNEKVTARVHAMLARAYTVIGRLMLDVPTSEMLCWAEAELASLQEDALAVCPWLAQATASLSDSMSQPLDEIRADYVRLFAGVRKLAAPPWESCYVSGKRQVCAQATEQARMAYLEARLCQDSPEPQLDDHIGLELQFLGSLSARIAGASVENHELAVESAEHRQKFVREHFGLWAELFSEDLEKAAETDFYRSLARLIGRLARFETGGD